MVDSSYQETGKSLAILKEVILLDWETLLRKVVDSSEHESTIILLDHIPDILNQLEIILKEGRVDERELGKHHGYYRSLMSKYSVADVLTEYSLLREVLIHHLYPMGGINCTKLVHKFLDILAKYSVTEYLKSQETLRSLPAERLGSETKEILENPIIQHR